MKFLVSISSIRIYPHVSNPESSPPFRLFPFPSLSELASHALAATQPRELPASIVEKAESVDLAPFHRTRIPAAITIAATLSDLDCPLPGVIAAYRKLYKSRGQRSACRNRLSARR